MNKPPFAFGRVFGLAASFVSELASIWGPLPMLVLAVPSAVAGFLALRQVGKKRRIGSASINPTNGITRLTEKLIVHYILSWWFKLIGNCPSSYQITFDFTVKQTELLVQK